MAIAADFRDHSNASANSCHGAVSQVGPHSGPFGMMV
jgi:hypothetical protein